MESGVLRRFTEGSRYYFGRSRGRIFSLTEAMKDTSPVWEALTQRHGLQPHGLKKLAHGAFGDFIFGVENDAFFDVNKARRFGFHEMHLDSTEAMVALMRQLQAEKLIPA